MSERSIEALSRLALKLSEASPEARQVRGDAGIAIREALNKLRDLVDDAAYASITQPVVNTTITSTPSHSHTVIRRGGLDMSNYSANLMHDAGQHKKPLTMGQCDKCDLDRYIEAKRLISDLESVHPEFTK